MSQTETGLRSLLSRPALYDFFQNLVGARRARAGWTRNFIRPFPGMRLLDIGCGTAELLAHLPADSEYTGFDQSATYIDAARRRYGTRGRFLCSGAEAVWRNAGVDGRGEAGAAPGGFDVAVAFGILHHLEDEEARALFRGAYRALKPGGRLVAIDPAYAPGQTAMARFLASRDRGRNVRSPEAYARLGEAAFDNVEVTVTDDALRIPYSHAVLVCSRGA